ncbi:MAG: DUF5723 family protein [Bacteroidota bacterium]|nr:DUF5723 family protein [Bacteroidota bacterium]
MKKRQIIFAILLMLLALPFGAIAQYNTLYEMKHVPQHNYFNPARQPDCKIYVGVPGISHLKTNIASLGPNYDDLFSPTQNQDSFFIDLDKIQNSLGESNMLNAEARVSILEFGFALGSSQYITFSVSNNTNQRFTYHDNLLDIRHGNYRPDGTPIEIKLKQELTNYNQYSLGYSKKFYNNLTIGARLNIYSGNAHFETNTFDIKWYTDPAEGEIYPWRFETDIDIQAAYFSDWEILTDSTGMLSEVELDTDFETMNKAKIAFSKNLGIGIDAGIDYRIFDWLNVSASVKDFGFIKWKDVAKNLGNTGNFDFSGVDLGRYITGMESFGGNNIFQDSLVRDLTDSLLLHFTPEIKQEADYSYTDYLSTQFYTGAEFYVTDWLDFGAHYHGILIGKQLFSDFSLSANANFLRGWAFSVNYTAAQNSYNNIGVGFAYKLGPFQMYFVTDNIAPGMYMWDKEFTQTYMYNTNSVNFLFGMNILICKNKYDYGLMF